MAIYESGAPSTASVILASEQPSMNWRPRTEYLDRIEQSDSDLARRVEQVRRSVTDELKLVAALKARVDAYDARLAAARSEIAGVRDKAETPPPSSIRVTASRAPPPSRP